MALACTAPNCRVSPSYGFGRMQVCGAHRCGACAASGGRSAYGGPLIQSGQVPGCRGRCSGVLPGDGGQIQAHLPLPEPTSQQPAIGEVLALFAGATAGRQLTRGNQPEASTAARQLTSKTASDLGAPLRNRTVDLLLTMDIQPLADQ